MRVGRAFSSIVGGAAEVSTQSAMHRALLELRSLVVRYRTGIALGVITALAFGLRAHGTDFGLPHLYYWDEPTMVNRAMKFGSGDLNPHFFVYPALYMYAIFALSGTYFVAGFILGQFSSTTDFGAQYFIDPTGIYLSARLMTAVVGSATVVLVYFVGRKYFGELVGLIGAVFLAVSVLHSTHSHVAIADVPQSLLIVAAYLPLHDVAKRGRTRDYLLAGLLIGVGIAVKYVAALLLPALLIAHFLRTSQLASGGAASVIKGALSARFALAGAAVLAGFFAGAPFNFLDPQAFWNDLREQSSISGGDGGNSLGFFLLDVLPADLGWPLYLASIGGLVLIATRRRSTDVLFLVFPVVYFLFFARYDRVFARYMIQEDPFLALTAAYAVVFVSTHVRARWQGATPYVALGLVVVALAVLPAYGNLQWNTAMSRHVDPRTQAYQWANSTLPDGTRVAIQPLFDRTYYNAPLQTDESLARLDSDIPSGPRFEPVRAQVFETLASRPTFTEVEFVYDFQRLKDAGVQYIFVSNLNWSLTVSETVESGPGTGTSEEIQFAFDLQREANLVAEFTPEIIPGVRALVLPIVPPTISVYEVR